jgi:D-alanine-D-alanine ligase
MRRRVLVLMGGRSSEHEVSLSSAQAVVASLDPARYEPLVVLISRRGAWTLEGEPVALVPGVDGRGVLMSLAGRPALQVDVVFPVLHGPFGEDGTIQGLCDTVGLPCVGAGVAASAVAMDKAMFKSVMRDSGLPVAEERVVMEHEWRNDPDAVAARVAECPGFPAFCKPARLGSSVGISPVPDAKALAGALELAFAHDSKALVERRVKGREVEVAVLGNGDDLHVSPVGEVTFDGDWYDYDTKYLPDRMRLVVPAEIPAAVAEEARDLSRRAFQAIGCAGMARVDFFLEDDRLIVSELNTIPGFTPTSVYASLLSADGLQYADIVDRLVELALESEAEREDHRH